MSKVPPGPNPPEHINVIIEISAHSDPVKYEMNKDLDTLIVDRFLYTSMQYPCNYGYVPATLSEDGDPVDVLVVTPFPIQSGVIIGARPIGMMEMEDEKGRDTKILAVPEPNLTPLYNDMHQPEDLPPLTLSQIEHFFIHYKDLEPNKWSKIHGWRDKQAAHQEIMDSIARYK